MSGIPSIHDAFAQAARDGGLSGRRLAQLGADSQAVRGALQRALQAVGTSQRLPAERGSLEQAVRRVLAQLRQPQGEAAPDVAALARGAVDELLGAAVPDADRRRQAADLVARAATAAVADGPKLAAEAAKIEQVAKGFESMFVQQLLDQMRKTVDEGGLLDDDGTGKQMRDMYWMFLGEQMGTSGSLGMWQQVASQLTEHGASGAMDIEV